MNIQAIHFEQATVKHKEIIFQWLDKPHVREFWDNSQRHRDDILDFMNGRKDPSPYFGGIMTYWVGMIDNDPFCFLLTSEFISNESSSALWNENCSRSGKTFTIDFCVRENNAWDSVGTKLIDSIHSIAKQKEATQILVVCGHHDFSKRQFLKDKQLKLASEWYVGAI